MSFKRYNRGLKYIISKSVIGETIHISRAKQFLKWKFILVK